MRKDLKNIITTTLLTIILAGSFSCKKSFLAPEPLSFYLPETAYTDVAGLRATANSRMFG